METIVTDAVMRARRRRLQEKPWVGRWQLRIHPAGLSVMAKEQEPYLVAGGGALIFMGMVIVEDAGLNPEQFEIEELT